MRCKACLYLSLHQCCWVSAAVLPRFKGDEDLYLRDQNRRKSEDGAELLLFYTCSVRECETILNYYMNWIMVQESDKYHNCYYTACKPGGSRRKDLLTETVKMACCGSMSQCETVAHSSRQMEIRDQLLISSQIWHICSYNLIPLVSLNGSRWKVRKKSTTSVLPQRHTRIWV